MDRAGEAFAGFKPGSFPSSPMKRWGEAFAGFVNLRDVVRALRLWARKGKSSRVLGSARC